MTLSITHTLFPWVFCIGVAVIILAGLMLDEDNDDAALVTACVGLALILPGAIEFLLHFFQHLHLVW